MTDRLKQDHARIREEIGRIRTLIAADAPPADAAAFAASRWALAREVMQNLMREEREVYGVLARDPRAEAVATGARFHAWLDDGFTGFRRHLAQWTGAAIERGWPLYVGEMAHILDLLERRMADEEAELFPLVPANAVVQRRPEDRNWAADGLMLRALIEAA